jgi:hypothetical protein
MSIDYVLAAYGDLNHATDQKNDKNKKSSETKLFCICKFNMVRERGLEPPRTNVH